ncbi:hypothetical protein HDU91_004216 [Kappamyces sp. JEL0680]|nr:hypothetical protein HDU91_004216 [Kappamyces sp. JEL0680]
MENYSRIPEFNSYLSYILTSNERENIRTVAGLTLKNNLKAQWSALDLSILDYCKGCVLSALSDENSMIRKVAGSIITTCVAGGMIERWPQVLPKLMELLDRPDTIVGAFGALDKICEDSCAELDEKDPNFVSMLLSKLLSFIDNPNPEIRANVLKCTNQFLMIRSDSIWNHFDAYMNILYKCTSDPSSQVKRYVCQAFNNVVELKPEVLIPVLDSVINFMLHVMQDGDKESGLEAADFFLIFSEQDMMHVHIQQYLPR